jgi:hypothetical protein
MNDFKYKFHRPSRSKLIGVIDKNGKEVARFNSIKECAKEIGMNRSYVNVLLTKGTRTSLGYGIVEVVNA